MYISSLAATLLDIIIIHWHRWTPLNDEELTCMHEADNIYNEYAILVMKHGMIVGHVPRTISKQFYDLLKSGGKGKIYRKSS